MGVISHGEQLPKPLIDGLHREIIDARLMSSMRLEHEAELDVVLMWLSPKPPARVLKKMSSWAHTRESRVGLIGCSPNGDTDDTIAGFEAGLDDFVAGRCSVRELASRIHALRQRLVQSPPKPGKTFAGLTLNPSAHEAQRGDRCIHLSPMEVAVLGVLLDANGRTCSRQTILEMAWHDCNFEVGERAVDSVILRLRRKLGEPDLIETVRGVGFRITSD